MDTMIPAVVSIWCLSFVSVMCVMAVWLQSVRDNLLERIGFGVLCFGALARAYALARIGEAPLNASIIHVGIALVFAGAMWAKVRIAWAASNSEAIRAEQMAETAAQMADTVIGNETVLEQKK